MEILQQSPKSVLKYYYIKYGIQYLIEVAIAASVFFIAHNFNWSLWVNRVILVFLIVSLIYNLICPWILLKYRFYIVSENHITILNTFFFRSESIIKIDRIQFLERNHGPIMRRFGLYNNEIVTAGHVLKLPLIDLMESETIETFCMSYLEKVDADV